MAYTHVDKPLKIGNIESNAKVPNAIAILEKLKLTRDEVAVAMGRVDNDGLSPEEAAQEWMAANEPTWKAWLP